MDRYVDQHVAASLGRMYAGLAQRLPRYPIPRWPFLVGDGRWLEIGCGWGRWTLAARRAGWRVIGLDRDLAALAAARRVAAALGFAADFVCADASSLPFRDGAFAEVFSYGAMQYLPPAIAAAALGEIACALRPGGRCRLQWPHAGGLRGRWARWRGSARFRTLAELRSLCGGRLGRLAFAAEGFFSTNARWEDRDLLPWRYRALVAIAVALRRLAGRCRWLLHLADAVWMIGERPS